ncbi:MAG: DUF805 domain-containing protein [Neomegalonema sp.]|nr:DUF805 domain-containing protein [Neomegalonema sp.]
MSNTQWYCQIGQERQGPFTVQQMRELMQSGQIDQFALVWSEGQGDWAILRDSALASELGSVAGGEEIQPGERYSLWQHFKRCFSPKFWQFSGRSRRPEFWGFVLFSVLTIFGLGLLGGVIAGVLNAQPSPTGEPNLLGLLGMVPFFLFLLAQIIPSIAVTVRRGHDIGLPAWATIIIAILGGSIVIGLIPSQKKPNKYGNPV